MAVDERMRRFAHNEVQWQRYKDCIEMGANAAARHHKVDGKVIYRARQVIERRAAQHMFNAEQDGVQGPTPDALPIKGTSTLVRLKDREDDSTGPVMAWIKTDRKREADLDAFREALAELTGDLKPLKPQPFKGRVDGQWLTVYPWGDPHIGMYAWAEEAGEDFDTTIARTDIGNAMGYLVRAAPPSETGVLLNLGDFFHADDTSNQTKKSGNVLDVDTRMPQVYRVGVQVIVDAISVMLRKHKRVIAWMRPGNHDPYSSQMLSATIEAFYHDEPRVEVRPATAVHDYLRHGKVLLGSTHGNMTAAQKKDLHAIMAADRPEDWGQTTHRHWLTGHVHHSSVVELTGGVTVETFRNLAPNDAWHQGEGYRSGRDMRAITYHAEFGEVVRNTCDIAMVRSKT